MSLPEHKRYFIDLDEEENVFTSSSEAELLISASLEKTSGNLWLSAHDGDRPWFHRIFGAKIWVRLYFAVVWHGEYAALMFFDENASELRARDPKFNLNLEPGIVDSIRFSEYDETEPKYILETTRAKAAINHFINANCEPDWLDYDLFK